MSSGSPGQSTGTSGVAWNHSIQEMMALIQSQIGSPSVDLARFLMPPPSSSALAQLSPAAALGQLSTTLSQCVPAQPRPLHPVEPAYLTTPCLPSTSLNLFPRVPPSTPIESTANIPSSLNHIKEVASSGSNSSALPLSTYQNLLGNASTMNLQRQMLLSQLAPPMGSEAAAPAALAPLMLPQPTPLRSSYVPTDNLENINKSNNCKVRETVKKESPSDFELGKISTETYYPTHFMKGTVIRLSSGATKKVEDLNSDDLLQSSAATRELLMEAASVLELATSADLARVTFLVGQPQYETSIEVQLEYPFFVLGKGWSSNSPKKTLQTYGMAVQQLKLGDVCITLTRKSEREAMQADMAVSLLQCQHNEHKQSKLAGIRDQLQLEMCDVKKSQSGRTSAPPPRFHPYEKPRKTSES